MRYTHIILTQDHLANLDKSIRISRILFSIDRIIVVVPDGQMVKYIDKIQEMKKNWKDIELKEISMDGIEICALDLCEIVQDAIVRGDGNKKDIILNISFSNNIFVLAGLFCASILKKKIISVVNGEPEMISRIPCQELPPIRYALLSEIPENGCNQKFLMDTLNKAIEVGRYQDLGSAKITPLTPTNLSYHIRSLDRDEYIIRETLGREKELMITNLGRLMKMSYAILHMK